jgi:nucleoside-diphosphate-sugar epimerase
MTALVTGATGLIGSTLANRLAAEGISVHALCRSEKKASALLHPDIKIYKGDVDDVEVLKSSMQGCDEVYHLAAFTGVWHRDPHFYHHVNVEGTRKVLEAATTAGVKSVVITSTAGVLGPSAGDLIIDETAPEPASFFTWYEESKAAMEKMARSFPSGQVRVVIVSPTRLYGPGPSGKSNSVTRMIVQYMTGKWRIVPGSGKGVGNYALIDDVVQGHILAAKNGRHGEKYILGGENLSYLEIFSRVAEVYGTKHALYSFPLPLMMVAVTFMKGIALITGKEPLLTPGWVRKYLHDWRLTSGKAIHELGYKITPFEEGIRKIINYYHL